MCTEPVYRTPSKKGILVIENYMGSVCSIHLAHVQRVIVYQAKEKKARLNPCLWLCILVRVSDMLTCYLNTAVWRFRQWASCQIRQIADAHAPGMPGTFSPPPRVSNPDMHHGTCVRHVPWCMPGSLTRVFLWIRRWGETFPAFPAHAQPAILRIW